MPEEIKLKIITLFKDDIPFCFVLMSVSKSFQRCIEHIYNDIYEISINLCSRKLWYQKTMKKYLKMVTRINSYCDLDKDPDDAKLLEKYLGGTLFKAFMHFFYCKRRCENFKNYCKVCSRVKMRHYQPKNNFEDVKVKQFFDNERLGFESRKLTFDIFMTDYPGESSREGFCRKEYWFSHPMQLALAFLSILARIHFNLIYSYYDDLEMSANDEKLCAPLIGKYVQKILNATYSCNMNYFFVIFEKFQSINHSACHDIAPGAEITYAPLEIPRKITNKDEYDYEYRLWPNKYEYSDSE